MKPWHKIDFSLLSDPRIIRLMDDMGPGGLGLYLMIRLNIECLGEGSLPLPQVMAVGQKRARMSKMMRVINDYDLFEVDEDCLVRTQTHTSVPASDRTSTSVPVQAPERTYEHVPIVEDKEQNRIRTDNTSIGSKVEVVDECFQKYSNESWFPCIAELLSPTNLIWREPLLMHCGYGALLGQHWTEAVLFFIEHAIIQNETDRLATPRDCKQYFANFSRITVPSGKALMEHLSKLNVNDNDTLRYDDDNSSGENDSRPPKPSPTAQWSYATEEWVEVH